MLYIGIAIAVAFGIALAPYILRLSAYAGIISLIGGVIFLIIAAVFWLFVERPDWAKFIGAALGYLLIAYLIHDWIRKTTWKAVVAGFKKDLREISFGVWRGVRFPLLVLGIIAIVVLVYLFITASVTIRVR